MPNSTFGRITRSAEVNVLLGRNSNVDYNKLATNKYPEICMGSSEA